ncbi:hypothetical protein A0257_16810 [Hymenobacter psoromatis]|nr:hypothetical protein A0257_16810 [Hymenobacter psoromatis]
MNTTDSQSNVSMAYLLGGVGLLAISIAPLGSMLMSEAEPAGRLALMAYWLVGALAINWAVRRFLKLGERVVAIVAIVMGWYMVLPVLLMLKATVFRF